MKNPVSTISGIVLLALAVVAGFGIINSEEQASLGEYAATIIEAVVGVIAILSGDPGKDESGV